MEPPTKRKKINKTEKSREYFTFSHEENGKTFYQCKVCEKNVNATKAANLTSHLKSHPDEYAAVCFDDLTIEHKRLNLLLNCVELVSVNGRAFKCLNDSAVHKMNAEILSELKTAGRPLDLTNPHLYEVKNELKKIAEEIRGKIAKEVKNRALSLLVDIVTKRGRSILGVSLQYIINKNVKIRSVAMIELKESHTGIYLADLIIERLKLFDIDLKQIITITTDNGSNVLKMVRDMETHLHSAVEECRQSTTPSASMQNQNNHLLRDIGNDEAVDREIDDIVSAEVELTDDQAIDLILLQIDGDDSVPNEFDLEANQNLLDVMQSNMENDYGLDVLWDVTGINCIVHTLQLVIKDAIKALGKAARNLISLARCAVKYLRLTTTEHELRAAGVDYNRPRIDVVTRWGSLYQMVKCHFGICYQSLFYFSCLKKIWNFFQLFDVLKCKNTLTYLAENKGVKMAELLLRKWNHVKEIVKILQIPYKATIALQKHDLTLSDAFGIWLQIKIHLQSPSIKRLTQTKLGDCLLNALYERQQTILNNPAMLSAIYLDPRFRREIMQNEQKVDEAITMLSNLWRRLNYLSGLTTNASAANATATNSSTETSSLNSTIYFSNTEILDKYLSRTNTSQSVQPYTSAQGLSIEDELQSFEPEQLSTSASIISYWESVKDEHFNLYQLAMVIYAIPPSETHIERDFSSLEFIFSQRRQRLCAELLESILTIHLNSDIFQIVRDEKLLLLKTI